MKFTLKDYQSDAVFQILETLKIAKRTYTDSNRNLVSSCSLSAVTGSGKTVIAAAVIESLFWGNESFNFEADPGATVLWFSDDPNLNIQTFNRLRDASEKLSFTNLVFIEPPFSKARLDPGKVYFLNTQKLTKNSLLTRGSPEPSDSPQSNMLSSAVKPDQQGWTIWETLANTIQSKDTTLYLVLDEAHRGFGQRSTVEKSTIVKRLINGTRSRPPIPIVLGISATIESFESAMVEAEAKSNRQAMPVVLVDPERVQESGLVKDSLILEIPDQAGSFDSVLVRRAARKLKESTMRWNAYLRGQGVAESVSPLMILQTPNLPDPSDIGLALDTIFSEYPDLESSSVRHVFGEHQALTFGVWKVDWIEPQRVQSESHVRVLIAKDAISTGWDCPRAEVLVSFRSARDHTHITQLIGRIVRNPLARRIPCDERLNAVDCILPFFDRATAVKVVRFLTGDLETMPGAEKKVVIDGRDLYPNPNLSERVWHVWERLPTETLPQRSARPIKRLVALAQTLSADAIWKDALSQIKKELVIILDTYRVRYSQKFDEAIREAWSVHVQEIEGRFGKAGLSYHEFVERADDRAIRAGFEKAKKAFGAEIAQAYINHLSPIDDGDDESDLRDAFICTTALATIKEVQEKVDRESFELTDRLFMRYRSAIRLLPDARQQVYEDIRAMATEPQRGFLRPPKNRIEGFSIEMDDGHITEAPKVEMHLMSDSDGNFPVGSLNSWERKIIATELAQPDIRGWYRNPARAAVDSLGVAYRDDVTGNWRSMHPDFIFFHIRNGEIVASIIDPHSHHLIDSLMKLKALANFAERYGSEFYRIEALSEYDGRMMLLNMQSVDVREAIFVCSTTAKDLYGSGIAVRYV